MDVKLIPGSCLGNQLHFIRDIFWFHAPFKRFVKE